MALQRSSYALARDSAVNGGHILNQQQLEPQLSGQFPQHGDVADALVAEAKVLAHRQDLHLQLGAQPLDERPRRQLGQGLGEAHDIQLRDAALREELSLAAQVEQPRWRPPRIEQRQRMGLERQRQDLQPLLLRAGPQRAQQGPVPAMDAVEIADGDRYRTRGRRPIQLDSHLLKSAFYYRPLPASPGDKHTWP